MKRAYADIPEGQVHYATEGSGEPFILLHESPRSWRAYARLIPLLAKTHWVIAMDTLGFGDSDPHPDASDMSDYSESVVHFMDSLGIDKANVMGDHTGACIALELAATRPERLRRLVLAGLPFWISTEERVARLEQTKGRDWDTQVDDGSHCTRIWQRMLTTRVPGGGESGVTEDDLEYVRGFTLDALRAGPRWKPIDLIVFSYDPDPRLPLVKSPALVLGVNGEGPSWYTKRDNEVHALIPGSTVVVIDGGDSRFKILRAQEVAETLQSFLATPIPTS